mmetsp:Transcript_40620/g.111786  ORF Transcript_40620/g.111786 Transcript_40620/m.111786 type:complete len:244 (-) Transcript_40620:311-1042(-)
MALGARRPRTFPRSFPALSAAGTICTWSVASCANGTAVDLFAPAEKLAVEPSCHRKASSSEFGLYRASADSGSCHLAGRCHPGRRCRLGVQCQAEGWCHLARRCRIGGQAHFGGKLWAPVVNTNRPKHEAPAPVRWKPPRRRALLRSRHDHKNCDFPDWKQAEQRTLEPPQHASGTRKGLPWHGLWLPQSRWEVGRRPRRSGWLHGGGGNLTQRSCEKRRPFRSMVSIYPCRFGRQRCERSQD